MKRTARFLAALLILLTLLSRQSAAGERPNILFCFADDWGRYASAYRDGETDETPNAIVSTPNFDRIAQEGVLFTNAFVGSPSCTPCRSALLSGQYFYRTRRGAILSGAVWDSNIPTYPLLLQQQGYHLGHTYKVWSPGTPRNAPYGAEATAYNRAGTRFNRFSQVVSAADDPEAAKQRLFGEVRENFRDFLSDRAPDQPFCYWFGPTNCHRTWVRGSGKALWGLDPESLRGKLPPFLPDHEVLREDFADYLGEVQAFDAALGVLLDELARIGQLENTLIVVSGDHGIPGFPQGKCNLYDFGVHVAMAVRWGEKVPGRRKVEDFVNLMDLAPTFLEAAGLAPPDVMTGRSLLEVLTSSKQGQVDPARDYVVVGRERHVDEARTAGLPYPQRAIRTKDFLYIRNFTPERWPMGTAPGYGETTGTMPSDHALLTKTRVAFADMDASPTKAWLITHREDPKVEPYFELAFARRPAEELYDLQNDPDQFHNLAFDPAYASRRKQLRRRLESILAGTGDPRVLGDGSTFDNPPYTTVVPRRSPR